MSLCRLLGHEDFVLQGPGTCPRCHQTFCARCWTVIHQDLCTHAYRAMQPQAGEVVRKGPYR